jgi:hypothetical protein
MAKRMVIERYVPVAEPEPSDGLPPMLALPPRDGVMSAKFVGRPIQVDAWSSEALVKFAKLYARTCCVALDIELDLVKAERDALAAELARLRA